jgi:hypothetical protein
MRWQPGTHRMDDRCVRSGSGYAIRCPPGVALHVDVVAFSLRKNEASEAT